MKILVVNAGSSSLKYQLIDMDTETVIAKGGCERIGIRGSNLKHKTSKGETLIEKDMPNHKVAIQLVLEALVNPEYGAIKSMDEIDAVGHRVVHSGEDFNCSVLLNDEVMKKCRANIELAPLHMPANILGIEACKEAMPDKPMALVFDTAFHSTMPAYAYMYAIDYNDYKEYKVRRYGFHGTSHKYVSQEAIKYLGKKAEDTKIITCHLGGGSSISAVKGGKCVDTSMGFTPLAGVPMGTRSGDIDPAVLEYLAAKKHYTVLDCINYLNKQCGVAGISGVSSDFRDLTKAADEGNERAQLALDVFAYDVKKYIGSYIAAMDGLDCLVFTAGIGENTWLVREMICDKMDYFGIRIDKERNSKKNDGTIHDISAADSKVKVLVIPTNEELVIARETKELLEG
ncbi:MAG TPA: acetate kinase [Candidatus Borkfalkia faecipullorum]|uniref:Acetate kinase n=1 Tax=Candidatus Borkfalkia faecipullorum TaxID=2838510 RepID=A0A9D1V6U5_9FIRM|nr:acetate kinase [Candidatus Borkfalkia faecipullorum]